MVGCLVGWSADLLVGRLVGWLGGWLVGWLVGLLVGCWSIVVVRACVRAFVLAAVCVSHRHLRQGTNTVAGNVVVEPSNNNNKQQKPQQQPQR